MIKACISIYEYLGRRIFQKYKGYTIIFEAKKTIHLRININFQVLFKTFIGFIALFSGLLMSIFNL